MINKGMIAPDFTLPDKDGNMISLSSFRGRKVVLYFYPKDNTPGCTRQAQAFRDNYEEFKKLNVEIVGISKDNTSSHARFVAKNQLPFVLLSDVEIKVIKEYGVWKEKKLYGNSYMGVERTTFIIDEDGVVTDIMVKVKPDTNASDILKALENKN